LRQLILAAQPSDLVAACEAGQLIEQRGFNRECRLAQQMEQAWREFREPGPTLGA
jgi:hypothetical protein